MKVQKTQINNEDVIQVFLSRSEAQDEENKKQLEELKETNKNVVVFLSGDRDIEQSLKYMLQFVKNKVEVN